jgi:uncharacterized NAD-dependent epimerase/dehydratase family protein
MVVMPTVASEIRMIESFADTRVIGVTLNHELMTDAELSAAIIAYELELGVPVTDPLTRPLDRLADMVIDAFPELAPALRAAGSNTATP